MNEKSIQEVTKNLLGESQFQDVKIQDEHTVIDVDNMPMIVWLRGDEEFFNDFSITADDAMEMLSIKRSRLRQISGKELRVGRTRMGRYIKPVYRAIDITEYKAWTRSTATHQKSSDAINLASEALNSTSHALLEGLNEANIKLSESLEDKLQDFILKNNENLAVLSERLADSQQTLLEKMEEHLQFLSNGQSESHNEIKEMFTTMKENLSLIEESITENLKDDSEKQIHDLEKRLQFYVQAHLQTVEHQLNGIAQTLAERNKPITCSKQFKSLLTVETQNRNKANHLKYQRENSKFKKFKKNIHATIL